MTPTRWLRWLPDGRDQALRALGLGGEREKTWGERLGIWLGSRYLIGSALGWKFAWVVLVGWFRCQRCGHARWSCRCNEKGA
jgi:hypothetical protein